jgi:hypothetical protein
LSPPSFHIQASIRKHTGIVKIIRLELLTKRFETWKEIIARTHSRFTKKKVEGAKPPHSTKTN